MKYSIMLKEIWRDIPWYEWLYKVSSYWNVISDTYNSKNRQLKHHILTTWYARVTLSKDNKTRWISIHRLVMLAFVWESKLQVNHIDWNKLNNNMENLEYVTRSENQLHAFRNGLQKPPEWKEVIASKDWNIVKNFNSIADACREYWLFSSNIIKAIKWEYSHCWWYNWQYK